ncbi:MAG: CheY-like chemotaxis protein [Planctomycetota bacterium]|jgi:CheY-like chemotaxis protein
MSAKLSILLVEHDLQEIKTVLRALDPDSRRDRIRVVQNAREALEIIQGNPSEYDSRPGLVLVDLDLPEDGCTRILKTLQADRELRSIPAIVMTASMNDPAVLRAYEHGAHSCVCKPFELEAFHATARGIEKYWHSLYPVAD